MDRQVEDRGVKPKADGPSTHLMCRTSLWGIAGFIGCAYFAWISFGHVARQEFEWSHNFWTAATYVVWIVLLGVLALDTRCLRERIFFGVLLINFFAGFALTLWVGIQATQVRTARIGTGALWTLGAVMSLATVGREKKS